MKQPKSPTLEQDLISFVVSKEMNIFQDRLYQPLIAITNWLLSKNYNDCSLTDKADIQQAVMLRLLKDLKYYRPNKGRTATSFARLIIHQEINKQRHIILKHYKHSVDYNTSTNNKGVAEPVYEAQDTIEDKTKEAIELIKEYQTTNLALTPANRTVLTGLVYVLTKHNDITTKKQLTDLIHKQCNNKTIKTSTRTIVQTLKDLSSQLKLI